MFEIGGSLREARMRMGSDLAEAEAATKIRSKYLRALEEERFELLPAQTYVKGFLHAYAEYLGLDGQLYVDEFNSRYVSGVDELAPYPVARRSARQSTAHRRVESSVVGLALVGIVATAALVVAAWKWGGSEPQAIPNLGEEVVTTEAAPAGTGTPAQPAPTGGVTLELTAATGNSWIAVYRNSATGELLFSGTLERGKRMTFTGRRLWVNAGTPENLKARINGDRSLIPSKQGGAPVALTVTPRGFRVAASAA